MVANSPSFAPQGAAMPPAGLPSPQTSPQGPGPFPSPDMGGAAAMPPILSGAPPMPGDPAAAGENAGLGPQQSGMPTPGQAPLPPGMAIAAQNEHGDQLLKAGGPSGAAGAPAIPPMNLQDDKVSFGSDKNKKSHP